MTLDLRVCDISDFLLKAIKNSAFDMDKMILAIDSYEKSSILMKEEKELENKGLLQIGYGSNEIEVSQNQAVIWYEDGISYCILNSNYNDLDKEDMINMAIEVINQN